MQIVEGKITIDASAQSKEIDALAHEIAEHLQEIKEIVVDDAHGVESSAFFSLLASIKKSAPEIKVTFLERDVHTIEGIGLASFDIRG